MKTAVEWLQQEVILQTNLPLNLENVLVFNKLIEQAKEMEKEQIKDAYKADLHPCSDDDAEQYYNETFKQKEQ
jgi:hypothetical protein